MIKTLRYAVLLVTVCVLFFTCRKKDKDDCPACPSVESISPTSGKGDDTLNIFGKNFASIPAQNIIKINGVQLTSSQILSGNSSQLKVRVPVDCGTGPVTVDLDAELTNYGDAPIFTYLPTFLVDSSIGGSGSNPPACISGQTGGNFTNYIQPTGIVVDPSGNVFFTDELGPCVFKLSPGDNYKSYCLLAGQPYQTGNSDGLGTFAYFTDPRYVYMDNNNNLFIAENTTKIRVISSSGNVSTWCTDPILTNMNGVAFQSGNPNTAYISTSDHVIYKVTKSGTTATVKVLAGSKGKPGFKDGADTTARFNNPSDIVVDNSGNIFVADRLNNVIRKITPVGVVSTFAGSGSPLLADGQGVLASFNEPRGLFLDADNSLFVADYNNNAIRKITASGYVSSFYIFTGAMASPNPRDVAKDKKGSIYVTFQSGVGNGVKRITIK